jgi:hypothetical protein
VVVVVVQIVLVLHQDQAGQVEAAAVELLRLEQLAQQIQAAAVVAVMVLDTLVALAAQA